MKKYLVNMYDSMPCSLTEDNSETHFTESKSFSDENMAIDYAKSQEMNNWTKIEVKDIQSNKIIYKI